MAPDQLFKKRKARKEKDMRRKAAKRKTYDRVLIVCEDGKSAPRYFETMRDHLRLLTAAIKICGEECGSDPVSVVKYAIETAKKEQDFDHVFCVVDRDQHPNFDQALDLGRRCHLPNKVRPQVLTSIPSFELWLLLHFT